MRKTIPIVLLCAILLLVFMGCVSFEEKPAPINVYTSGSHTYFIVDLKGHKIDDIFDLEGTFRTLFCSLPNDFESVAAVISYADVANGGTVGWYGGRFAYTPVRVESGAGFANLLFYDSDIEAMPLEDAQAYIPCMKISS